MAGRNKVHSQGRAMEDMGKVLRANLMDDFYMRKFFDKDVEYIQYVLRVIMGDKGLVVKSVKTQRHLKGSKRRVFLDIYAIGPDGTEYDIEVQRRDEEASPERAFYNLAMLKTDMLEKRRPYSDLRRAVVIFITEHDVIGDNLPLYTAEFRVNETGKPLGVDALILYVNNEIQDPTTELGRLMHDFSCSDPDRMYSHLLAGRTRQFKDTEEGRSIMSTVWKEAQDEAAQREREATARIMLEDGESAERTARYSRLPIAEVRVIARGLGLASAL